MSAKNKLSEKNKMANGILKVALCIVGLCAVMCIMLAIYNNTVPEKLAEYEAKGDMEHTAWLLRYGSYLPPVIAVAVILTAVYSYGEYLPVKTQKQKAVIIAVVCAFTSLAMLPFVKGESPEKYDGCIGWFLAQIIPFLIVFSYHMIRASSEKKELEENEE